MKTRLSFVITMSIVTITIHAQPKIYQSEKLQKIWEATGFSVPESVMPVRDENIMYVSNIGSHNASDQENLGFISIINSDGSVKNLRWVTGLNSPKGMALIGKKLYVTEVNKITEIDRITGKTIKSTPIDSAVFLNDITTDDTGNLYISDSKTGTVFKLSGNKVTVFVRSKDYAYPNGLVTAGDNILFGTGDKVVSINSKSGNVKDFMLNTGGVDGIALLAPDLLLFSNWGGTVYSMNAGKDKELLLDTSGTESVKSADFGYIASDQLIYIPTFFGNSVVCYKLNL
jgi:DNA-binding beta-propeller fold protein YncE